MDSSKRNYMRYRSILQILTVLFVLSFFIACASSNRTTTRPQKTPYQSMSIAQIRSLSDEQVLVEVAKTHPDSLGRRIATQKITDPATLNEIAENDAEKSVRLAAIERITDSNRLFEIVNDETEDSVRIYAVMQISDPEILNRIALKHPSRTTRREAVRRVDDLDVLEEISKNDSMESVRDAALARIAELKNLSAHLKEGTIGSADMNLVKSLTDQKMLIEVAKFGRNPQCREVAIRKIDDQKTLSEIAGTDSDMHIRRAAIEKLTDQKILREIATNYTLKTMDRSAAVKRIKDPELLFEIARNDPTESVRKLATDGITDEMDLLSIAKTNSIPAIREHAFKKIGLPMFSCVPPLDTKQRNAIGLGKIKCLIAERDVIDYYGPLSLSFEDQCERRDYIERVHGGAVSISRHIIDFTITSGSRTIVARHVEGDPFPGAIGPGVKNDENSVLWPSINFNEISLSIIDPLSPNTKNKLIDEYMLAE